MCARMGRTMLRNESTSILSSGAQFRSFNSSSKIAMPSTPSGFFSRPPTKVSQNLPKAPYKTDVAQPHTPPGIPTDQAPNYPTTWSETQNPRELAMRGPRFEQITTEYQPQPLSAMEMIQREPIRLTAKRVIECDGGDGPLGHPRVFINLDKPGPKACPYWYVELQRSMKKSTFTDNSFLSLFLLPLADYATKDLSNIIREVNNRRCT